LTDLGQIKAAIDCFRKAIALKPDYAVAYNNLGSVLKMGERFKEAIACFSQAVQANPVYAEGFNNLGETLSDMGKPDEAISFFEKALELKPEFGLATGNLLYALIRTCDWEQSQGLNLALDTFTAEAIEKGRRPPEDPSLNLVRHDSPRLNFARRTPGAR
jgi:tetratricopeptide (TPR) repeat protein